MKKHILHLGIMLTSIHAYSAVITTSYKQLSPQEYTIHATITPNDQEIILKDGLLFTTGNPDVILSSWHADKESKSLYDTLAREHKQGYPESTIFSATASLQQESVFEEIPVHIHYFTTAQPHPHTHSFTIPLPQIQKDPVSTEKSLPVAQYNNSVRTDVPRTPESFLDTLQSSFTWLKINISTLVEKTESPFLRIILVFILGLLMSLTPCIYPMIPITVGILQTSSSSSLGKNFLLALSYTLGIACTFALLGLLAAFGSTQFGMLLGNPFFVILLVFFLGYLALSMLGLYDMYIPRFLQPKNHTVQRGSYLSAFIFGALSGSVASPCLSPGLLLLLSIVATVGSKIMGFIWLFMFGLGLGLPLLIIGTFSSSLQLMPQAGLWMIEIKRFFGIMLLSMCFYYLNNILDWHYLLILATLTTALCGIFYFISIEPFDSKPVKRFKELLGTLLIIGGCCIGFFAYKASQHAQEHPQEILCWITSYDIARNKAVAENKRLLLDFTASWCTACKAIEKKILHAPEIMKALDTVILVKIDCSNPTAECCADIQKKFSILGYPTLLLVNPENETVLYRWGSELLDIPLLELAELLK